MRQFQVKYLDLDARAKHGLCEEEIISADGYDLNGGWFRFWIDGDMKKVSQIRADLVRSVRSLGLVPTP